MKRLRREGRPDEATEVAGAKKPTLPAWLATQLVAREPELVRQVLDAGERLREAQRRTLGGAEPQALRDAVRGERDAVQAAVQAAERLFAAEGRSAAGAMLERLAETLRAAASNDEAREAFERGRVTREYERSGFGGLIGLLPEGVDRPGAALGPGPRDELADRRRRRDEQERRVRELRAQVSAAEGAAAAAEVEADRAEREAEGARRHADELRDEADRLAEELEVAEEEARPPRR